MMVVRLVLAVLTVVLMAKCLTAEEDRPQPRSLASELTIQTVAAGLDLASTEWALAAGGQEVNPLGQRRSGRIAVKAAGVVGVAAIAWKLERTGRPGWARAVRWGAVLLQVLVAGWNTWQGLEARR